MRDKEHRHSNKSSPGQNSAHWFGNMQKIPKNKNLASILKKWNCRHSFFFFRFSQIPLSDLHLCALEVKQCDILWLIILSVIPERHHKVSDNKKDLCVCVFFCLHPSLKYDQIQDDSLVHDDIIRSCTSGRK